MLNIDSMKMYIKGMMSDNGNKNKKKLEMVMSGQHWWCWRCFFIFAQPISVGFSVFVFVMILMLNAYVFLDSDWKVSRKMESKKTFDKIQKCAFCFFHDGIYSFNRLCFLRIDWWVGWIGCWCSIADYVGCRPCSFHYD